MLAGQVQGRTEMPHMQTQAALRCGTVTAGALPVAAGVGGIAPAAPAHKVHRVSDRWLPQPAQHAPVLTSRSSMLSPGPAMTHLMSGALTAYRGPLQGRRGWPRERLHRQIDKVGRALATSLQLARLQQQWLLLLPLFIACSNVTATALTTHHHHERSPKHLHLPALRPLLDSQPNQVGLVALKLHNRTQPDCILRRSCRMGVCGCCCRKATLRQLLQRHRAAGGGRKGVQPISA